MRELKIIITLPFVLAAVAIILPANLLADDFTKDFVTAAIERTSYKVAYNSSYYSIPYPNGDVPPEVGVCTDVIIRSYRTIGTDLQKLVYEDISKNFSAYPSRKIWGLTRPDKNIDHRRVPNLQAFFKRHGESLAISNSNTDYKPGDIVTWSVPENRPHIGIVTDKKDQLTGTPLIIHNIGRGPELQNMLFQYKITGHYRYIPDNYRNPSE